MKEGEGGEELEEMTEGEVKKQRRAEREREQMRGKNKGKRKVFTRLHNDNNSSLFSPFSRLIKSL